MFNSFAKAINFFLKQLFSTFGLQFPEEELKDLHEHYKLVNTLN